MRPLFPLFLFSFWPFLVHSIWQMKDIIQPGDLKSKVLFKGLRGISDECFEEQIYICTVGYFAFFCAIDPECNSLESLFPLLSSTHKYL